MGLKESVAKLKDELTEAGHLLDTSINRFIPLNVDKIAKKLELVERGTERGQLNQPQTDDSNLDEVELAIVDIAQSEFEKNRENLAQSQATYKERYFYFYNPSVYGNIETDARDCISEFRKNVDDGMSQLQIPAERLKETATERRNFRAEHNLNRTAHYPEAGGIVLRAGIIAVLLLIETLANGNFLAKGSDYGLIGGVIEAITIACLNLGIAVVIGYWGLRQLWHRDLFRKFLGLLSLCVWILFTLVFNLLVAHYRETAGIITEIAGFIVDEFLVNPIGLNDFQSWVLFGIGFLFALIALIDSLTLDDLYPFYGALDRKYERLRLEYKNLRSRLIDELDHSRNDVIDQIKEARTELDRHDNERRTVLIHSADEQRAFRKFVDHLNYQCNQLLDIYRSVNANSRKTSAPERYGKRYDLGVTPADERSLEKPESVDTSRFQNNLQDLVNEFYSEFDQAVRTYPQLAEITRDSADEKSA